MAPLLSYGSLSSPLAVLILSAKSMRAKTVQSDYVSLYRQAFVKYRAHALWHMRAFDKPNPEDALAVARALRVEAPITVRRLAEQIEQA